MSSTVIKDFKKVANEEVTRHAGGAINAGDAVKYAADSIDVVQLATGDPLALVVGIATESAANGDQVKLVVSGVADVLINASAVAIGDLLQADATTAGVLTEIVPQVGTITLLRDDLALTSRAIVPLAAETSGTAAGVLTKCVVRLS